MHKKITTLWLAGALAVGGVLGYAGASYQYSTQLDKAKAVFPSLPTMTIVSGSITSVSGNTITLQTQPSANPFENLPVVRRVTVTSATKIIKSAPKDPIAFQREMDAFLKASQKTTATSGAPAPIAAALSVPPRPTTETELKVSDLKAGDIISVDAGKDVKTQASFDAVTILFSGSASLAAPSGISPGVSASVNNPPPALPAGVNQGTAPMVNNPPPTRVGGGTAPIVNTPPPATNK